MSNIINLDFKKREQFSLCSCSYCGTQYKIFKQPDARTPVIFLSKDQTSRLCEHCVRIMHAQLKGMKE